MNRIIITGRITKDLELKETSSGKSIVNYQVAVQRTWKNADGEYETDFIPCTTFGESAKTLCEYIHKGDLIGVEGVLQTSQYVDNEGKKHTSFYILTDKVQYLSTNKRTEEPKADKSIEKTELEITEDDLPF